MYKHSLLTAFLLLALGGTPASRAAAQTTPLAPTTAETFVRLTDGRLRVFDNGIVLRRDTIDGRVRFHLAPQGTRKSVAVASFPLAEVATISPTLPADIRLTQFDTYAVEKKHNPNVAKNAAGTPTDQGARIDLRVVAIDRTLRPSFALPAADALLGAKAYIGDRLQESGRSLVSLAVPVTYTLAFPAHRRVELQRPEGVSAAPADYRLVERPYGRRVVVACAFPAQTAGRVPRIDIRLKDGVTLADIHNNKDKYRRAEITIDGAGIWDNLSDSVTIKGRGNSTWSFSKKPYRLKFAKGKTPFGLPKGKSWVLLANALGDYSTGGGANLNNAIAMKAAQLVGTAAANHMIPVDLYINGDYEGTYNFTEQVGISGNSVDLPNDSTAALLELDSYEHDGDPFFNEETYGLRTKYKDPDPDDYLEDYGREAYANYYNTLHSEFNRFTAAVKAGNYDRYVDIPALVRFFLVNDLVGNLEFGHPKSIYLFRSNVFDSAEPWTFGPVWDCDWAYGYETNHEFGVSNPEFDALAAAPQHRGRAFFQRLMTSSEEVRRQYFYLWHSFLNDGGLEALLAFIDDYRAFAQPSFTLDVDRWYKGPGDYSGMAARLKNWLSRRAKYIYSALEPFPLDTPTAVESVRLPSTEAAAATAEAPSRAGVYTLAGQRVDLPRTALPAGIYLIDGRKVVVR